MNDHLSILAARMRQLAAPHSTSTPVVTATATTTPPTDPLALLTLAEAAGICRVHARTIRRWPLPWIVLGRIVRVQRADLDAYLTSQKQAGVP